MSNSFLWRKQILEDVDLHSTTKLVAMMLHYHMDNNSCECFPSEALIAKEASLTERCVVNHIKKLKAKSYIHIRKEMGGKGWNKNCYKGIIRTQSHSKPLKEVSELETKGSEFKTSGNEHEDQKIVNEVHTNSSNNSPYNSSSNSNKDNLVFLKKFVEMYPDKYKEETYESLYDGWIENNLEATGKEICLGLENWILNDNFNYHHQMFEIRFLMEERWKGLSRYS